MLDLLIRGGDVVTPQGVGAWEVAVEGERIVALGLPDGSRQARRVIDATGKVVVPGGIEPHTHLAHFISMHPEDNLYTLGPEEDTRGMVFGGTTTHVDFCFVRPGTDIPQAIETRAVRWKGNSYADYSFHVALQGQLPIPLFDQIPEAIQAGFPSFKVFTVEVLPPHPKRHPYRLDFGRIQLAMEKVAAHGGIMAVHAEDHDLVQFNYEKFREEKQTDGWLLPLVHNKLSELLAFRRTTSSRRRPAPASTSSTPRPRRGWRRSPRRGPRGSRSTPRRSITTPASPPRTTRRRAASATTRIRR